MKTAIPVSVLFAALLIGCASVPAGPSVMVWPAPDKTFETFQDDDAACRQWALGQAGGSPDRIANDNLAQGAALGTVAGAAAGALVGAASGNAGAGAAIGAGAGLLGGAAVASGPSHAARWEVQRRYDMAYEQCMFAKGNDTQNLRHAPVRRMTSRRPPPPPRRYRPVPPPPEGPERYAPPEDEEHAPPGAPQYGKPLPPPPPPPR